MEKIIRSVCYFADQPDAKAFGRAVEIAERLTAAGFTVQTRRLCAPVSVADIEQRISDPSAFLSVGSLDEESMKAQVPALCASRNTSCNLDLTSVAVESKHVELLFEIIGKNPFKTFNFAYVFHNAPASPFFPSAAYAKNGFAIGLQSTNLSEGCKSLNEWLHRMKTVWEEIIQLCGNEKDFLGIDSSVAPLFEGMGSLVNFLRRLEHEFPAIGTTLVPTTITSFLKEQNPRPVGLCGLMLPCLEDFELAEEYERGEFSIERNLYLSLHSGLGIDTYPIGIDEDHGRVLQILQLVQALSAKYKKPLSVRFVSDGKARIGDKTKFTSPYLKNVVVRKL